MTKSLFSSPRLGRLFCLAASVAGMAACSEEDPPANNTTPIGVSDSGAQVLPGYDAGFVAIPDSGLFPTNPLVDGAVAATDGTVPGATDSLWCKAKAVIDSNCTSCHGAVLAAGAPMTLTTYESTQGMGPTTKTQTIPALIKNRIHLSQGAMPPGGGLTAEELATLDAWVDGGAQAGTDKLCAGNVAPPDATAFQWPAECTEKYRYKILAHGATPTTPVSVAAGVEAHPKVNFDAPWGSTPVQALAMNPITDNAKVLHHWILYATGGAFVTGWAPGKDKRVTLPDDVGLYLPSGTGAMYLDLHYNNLPGKTAEQDMSGVEICAVPKEMWKKNTATVFMGFGANSVVSMAPANTMGHRQTKTCTITSTQPVHLLTSSPHAHTLAHAMDFRAKVKGQEIILHQGPFDFEEQKMYPVPGGDIILNGGDSVTTTCVYDNPTNKSIAFGENTGNEMCFNFAVYYPMGALHCQGGDLGVGI